MGEEFYIYGIKGGITDNFTLDTERIAYDTSKTDKVFKVYESSKDYVFGMFLGKIRIILDDDKNIIAILYPMMSIPTSYPNEHNLIEYRIKYVDDLRISYNLYKALNNNEIT